MNVTSTRVEVRWNPGRSRALAPEEKERLAARLGGRLDGEGWLRVAASDTRSQRQNRELALARLTALVAKALIVPKKRKKTKLPAAAREKRLKGKKRQSEKKRQRRNRDWHE